MPPTTDDKRRQARSGAAVRDALDLDVRARRELLTVNGCTLWAHPQVEYAMVVKRGLGVYIHQDTWDALRWGRQVSLKGFISSFLRADSPDGLRFLSVNVDWWAEALRKHAGEYGSDVVRGKDKLTLIEEELIRLVAVASDFGAEAPSREHLKMYFERLTILGGELEDLESRLGHLRGLMDLARLAMGMLAIGGPDKLGAVVYE